MLFITWQKRPGTVTVANNKIIIKTLNLKTTKELGVELLGIGQLKTAHNMPG